MAQALLTLAQVAEILNVSYARASQLARQGILPVVRLHRQYRVDPKKLERFIAGGGRALPGNWRRQGSA